MGGKSHMRRRFSELLQEVGQTHKVLSELKDGQGGGREGAGPSRQWRPLVVTGSVHTKEQRENNPRLR